MADNRKMHMTKMMAAILGMLIPFSAFSEGVDDVYFISCFVCKSTVAALSFKPSSDTVFHIDETGIPFSGNCTRNKTHVSCVMQNTDKTVVLKFVPVIGPTKELMVLTSPEGTVLTVYPGEQTASYVVPISTKIKTKGLLASGAKVCHCSLRKQ